MVVCPTCSTVKQSRGHLAVVRRETVTAITPAFSASHAHRRLLSSEEALTLTLALTIYY